MVAIRADLYQLAMWGDAAPVVDLAKERKKRAGAKAGQDALQVFSFGGGVQSMAALVLAAQGRLPIKFFLFADVGADSENPATIRYVDDVAIPYARRHGLEVIKVQRTRKDGTPETIRARETRPGSRSIGLPVRMSNGAPGRRACTGDFKIKPVAKWLKAHGASKSNPAQLSLGISLDEFQRMRNDSGIAHVALAFPLIDMRLTRADCLRIIEQEGLPLPEKSSCFFCPFHTLKFWQWQRHNRPTLFAQAVELERFVNVKRAKLGLDQVWFSSALKPLEQATSAEVQMELPEEEEHNCGAFTCSIA